MTQEASGDSPGEDSGAPGQQPGRRWRWRWPAWADPLLVACSLTALAVYLPRGFDGLLYRDLGAYAYGAQQVAEGETPYLAMVNRAGPLAQLLPGLGVVAGRLVGADDVLAMRVLFLVFSVVAVGLAYLVGRDALGSRHAGVATAAALACFGGFVELATYGPREKTPMVMFLLASILAVAHRRWFTAGVLIALATLTWQPVFPAALTVAVVAALIAPRRFRSLGLVALGGLVPTALVVAWYLAIGALEELLDNFVLISLEHARSPSLLRHPTQTLEGLSGHYGASLWILPVGLAAVVLVAVVAAFGGTGQPPQQRATTVAVGAGALAASAWTVNSFNGWPDGLLVLPFAAVGIGGLVLLVTRVLPTRAAWTFTTAVAAVGVALAASFGWTTRDDSLTEQRAEVDAVLGALPPGAAMVGMDSPQSLVLADMEQEPRVLLYSPAINRWLDEVYPGGVTGYVQGVLATDPAVVATDGRPPEAVAAVLERDYVRIEKNSRATWWVHPEDRERVRVALKKHVDSVEN
jgi:hypothetical protein